MAALPCRQTGRQARVCATPVSHHTPARAIIAIMHASLCAPLQIFGKLLEAVDEAELSAEEAKERKIMKLLLKVKNGTPPQRKSALRQLTEKARDFGAKALFDQILPLLMTPTLEDQERHLLVKVIDRCVPKCVSRVCVCMHVCMHASAEQVLLCMYTPRAWNWCLLLFSPLEAPDSPLHTHLPAWHVLFPTLLLPHTHTHTKISTGLCTSLMSWYGLTCTRFWSLLSRC
jgi:hypothetical protein